jgi:hypothetical protein
MVVISISHCQKWMAQLAERLQSVPNDSYRDYEVRFLIYKAN